MSNNENNSIIEFGVQVFSLTKYSSYQRCILMRIYKYTQKDISDAISSQKNDHLIHFTPAEESEQVRHVKIPLKRKPLLPSAWSTSEYGDEANSHPPLHCIPCDGV